jgi:hypothetical protein
MNRMAKWLQYGCGAAHHPLGSAQILAACGQTAAMPDSEWRKKNSWNFPVS